MRSTVSIALAALSAALGGAVRAGAGTAARSAPPPVDQLGLFGAALPDPIVERLKGLDANALTPMQALALLADLSADARTRQ